MIEEIKKLLKGDKLVIGSDKVLKHLKKAELCTVYLAKNMPEKIEKEIAYYADMNGVEVKKLSIPNDELGAVCKKPFSVLILGVLK